MDNAQTQLAEDVKLYLSLKDVPELASLAPNERRRIHGLCLQRYFLYAPPSARSLAAYSLFLVSSISFAIVGSDGASTFFSGARSIWSIFVPMGIGVGLGCLVFRLVAIPGLRPFYKKCIEIGL